MLLRRRSPRQGPERRQRLGQIPSIMQRDFKHAKGGGSTEISPKDSLIFGVTKSCLVQISQGI